MTIINPNNEVNVDFKFDIDFVWLLIDPFNVVDVAYKLLIDNVACLYWDIIKASCLSDNVELVDKLFKVLKIVVDVEYKFVINTAFPFIDDTELVDYY